MFVITIVLNGGVLKTVIVNGVCIIAEKSAVVRLTNAVVMIFGRKRFGGNNSQTKPSQREARWRDGWS